MATIQDIADKLGQYKISLINWAFPKALYQKRLITLQTLAKLYEKQF